MLTFAYTDPPPNNSTTMPSRLAKTDIFVKGNLPIYLKTKQKTLFLLLKEEEEKKSFLVLQEPRDLGKYKSSEWLLEKLAIS